jgi:hypothetical protein
VNGAIGANGASGGETQRLPRLVRFVHNDQVDTLLKHGLFLPGPLYRQIRMQGKPQAT